ncbi:MAG TPA: hypothetical protein VGM57_14425 [Pseudolabrys sp.]
MSTIGINLPSLLNYISDNSAPKSTSTPSLAQVLGEVSSTVSQSSTNVTLSDDAKAYLASLANAVSDASASANTLATKARSWFDQQYKDLGISSAMLDGKTAVDLTQQSRATLSAVAANTNSLFSPDETAAATNELQSRFNDAMAPQVVIARHNSDYTGLYSAALSYMDQAGADEKTTVAWQAQYQALTDGAAAAKLTPSTAPDTGDTNDPVRALLDSPTAGTTSADASTDSVAANARAMLDDQINAAKDNGTQLVFNSSQKVGQQADWSQFDNRTLAAVALNQGSSFSTEEVRSAKAELDQRNRASILSAVNQSDGSGGSSLAMLQQYANMSTEEKSALGLTDQFANRLIQSYQSAQQMQSILSQASAPTMTSFA